MSGALVVKKSKVGEKAPTGAKAGVAKNVAKPIAKKDLKRAKAKGAKGGKPAAKAKKLSREPDFTAEEKAVLDALDTPPKIQAYLDSLPYDPSDFYPSVRHTLKHKRAHCVGGGLLAAYCLERHGYGAAKLFELRTIRDDDHVIAVYQLNGCWGAVSKSNFTGMRGRDPVYQTLRELAMSYHEQCINSVGEKTLRAYTAQPLLLATIDKAISHRYGFQSGALKFTMRDIYELDHDKYWGPVQPTNPTLGAADKSFPAYLPNASRELIGAALLGSNPAGLYVPGK